MLGDTQALNCVARCQQHRIELVGWQSVRVGGVVVVAVWGGAMGGGGGWGWGGGGRGCVCVVLDIRFCLLHKFHIGRMLNHKIKYILVCAIWCSSRLLGARHMRSVTCDTLFMGLPLHVCAGRLTIAMACMVFEFLDV